MPPTIVLEDMFAVLAEQPVEVGTKLEGRMATTTRRKVRTRLKSVFQEAVNDQLIFVNPVASVKPIKLRPDEEEHVGTALDFDQAAHLQKTWRGSSRRRSVSAMARNFHHRFDWPAMWRNDGFTLARHRFHPWRVHGPSEPYRC